MLTSSWTNPEQTGQHSGQHKYQHGDQHKAVDCGQAEIIDGMGAKCLYSKEPSSRALVFLMHGLYCLKSITLFITPPGSLMQTNICTNLFLKSMSLLSCGSVGSLSSLVTGSTGMRFTRCDWTTLISNYKLLISLNRRYSTTSIWWRVQRSRDLERRELKCLFQDASCV